MYQPSAPLLESRKAALHVLQIWICLAQENQWRMDAQGVTQPTDAKGTQLALRGLLPDKGVQNLVYTVPSISSASPLSLDVLVAVTKLVPQLGLVQFDIILQLSKILLLLCAKRGLLVLSIQDNQIESANVTGNDSE